MRYVAQLDKTGCLVASTAMVLDLTYADVAQVVPTDDASRYPLAGSNDEWWQVAFKGIQSLASAKGETVVELERPYMVQFGLRYLAMVPTDTPNFHHVLAVDETGIAFDPCNEDGHKPWSEYQIIALLEFQPSGE